MEQFVTAYLWSQPFLGHFPRQESKSSSHRSLNSHVEATKPADAQDDEPLSGKACFFTCLHQRKSGAGLLMPRMLRLPPRSA